jgi:hypothetical protein
MLTYLHLLLVLLRLPALPAGFAVLDEPVQIPLDAAVRARVLSNFVDIAPVRHRQRSFIENFAIVENLLKTC